MSRKSLNVWFDHEAKKNLGLGLTIETAKTNFGPCSSLTPLNRFPTLQGTFYVFLCVPPLKIFCWTTKCKIFCKPVGVCQPKKQVQTSLTAKPGENVVILCTQILNQAGCPCPHPVGKNNWLGGGFVSRAGCAGWYFLCGVVPVFPHHLSDNTDSRY